MNGLENGYTPKSGRFGREHDYWSVDLGLFFQTKTKPYIMAVMTSTSHMNKPLRTCESKRGRCFELRISTSLNYHVNVVGYNHLDVPSISWYSWKSQQEKPWCLSFVGEFPHLRQQEAGGEHHFDGDCPANGWLQRSRFGEPHEWAPLQDPWILSAPDKICGSFFFCGGNSLENQGISGTRFKRVSFTRLGCTGLGYNLLYSTCSRDWEFVARYPQINYI